VMEDVELDRPPEELAHRRYLIPISDADCEDLVSESRMKVTFRLHLGGRNRRTITGMNLLEPFHWKWAWGLLAVLICLCGLATIEPETAEAVNSTIGVGALACVLWGIWQLMQMDQ
jgi:hypothetical protein